MSKSGCICLLVSVICLSVITVVPHANALNELALGEMSIYGDVFIRSSTGNWMPAPSIYPILPNTEIRIEKGAASLFYNDGSRIDLSESSMASLTLVNSGNRVYLSKGKASVNTMPGSSFIFSHGASDIVVTSPPGNQGKSSAERFLGIVSSDDKGIGMQSIAGSASVTINNALPTDISSGGSIFVSPDNKISTYETTQMNSRTKKCEKKKKPHKHCSPSNFYDEEYYCYYE